MTWALLGYSNILNMLRRTKMFDKRLMLSYLDGLINESAAKRAKKREEIINRTGLTGKMIAGDVEPKTKSQEGGLKAIRALEEPGNIRYAKYQRDRRKGQVVPGRSRRVAAAQEQAKTSTRISATREHLTDKADELRYKLKDASTAPSREKIRAKIDQIIDQRAKLGKKQKRRQKEEEAGRPRRSQRRLESGPETSR